LDLSFGLSEIQAVIKSNKNSIFQSNDTSVIRQTIKKYDVYNFLLEIDETNIVDKSGDVFSFAHVTIPQSIYDMSPYETRISLHKALARYYESQLTRDNYPQLLAKVTRHYLETDWYGKQLYYLEALADLNMRSYFLAEATSNLERMVKILDENEELAEEFGRMHRSDIYRMLGMCLTMRTKLNEGEHYLFLALQCLDSPWPRSDLEFGIKFWRNRFIQYRHRKYVRMTMIVKPLKERKAQSAQRIVEIMAQLSNIYFYTGKGRDFIYSCLIGLNACERLRDTGPNYSLFLARFSLVCWLNDQKENSIFYITKALQQVEEKADAGTFTICALLCFAAGRFENARNLLYQSIQVVKVFGVVTDCQAFYRSVGLAITMRIFEGTLDQSPAELALLKQMADTAHMNGDYEAEIWLSVYHICNGIVVDRIRDCEPFVVLVEAHLKQAADYNKIAMHGALIAYYARAGRYDLAKRHIRHLNNVLPTLTVTGML
jgi:tetratricopeptide (TPR) repeat protein